MNLLGSALRKPSLHFIPPKSNRGKSFSLQKCRWAEGQVLKLVTVACPSLWRNSAPPRLPTVLCVVGHRPVAPWHHTIHHHPTTTPSVFSTVLRGTDLSFPCRLSLQVGWVRGWPAAGGDRAEAESARDSPALWVSCSLLPSGAWLLRMSQ